uniref:Uncharacterized protein n=1 Tax=Acrobeloides nanus TaxID=290746 RepID=A0A914ED70_9BILA
MSELVLLILLIFGQIHAFDECDSKNVITNEPNVVNVEVYMEAECKDTTRFMRQQLLPTWDLLKDTGRVIIQLIPFGKADCQKDGDDYHCHCHHNESECDLNKLMNCVIEQLPDQNLHIPIIGCIQGKEDFDMAYETCIIQEEYLDPLKILNCAQGKRGRQLLGKFGEKTNRLQQKLKFTPWILLDGERIVCAFYALDEYVCDRLDPKPEECEKIRKPPS